MKPFRKSWWYLGIGLIALALIWAAYRFAWPGTGFQGKTVWDWLQLLIIPLALALVALFFNLVNTRTERQIAQKRYEQDKMFSDTRYNQDQKIALDKQAGDLFQAYLDRMSELLEKELRTSPADAEVRNMARVRTISTLIQLDARRIGYVFSFLREAGLTNPSNPTISLKGADLSRVNWFEGANLSEVNLSEVNLSRANLSRANLYGANLNNVNLSEANLNGVGLSRALILEADFSKADLSKADLNGANLGKTNLSKTNLTGALQLHLFAGRVLSRQFGADSEVTKW